MPTDHTLDLGGRELTYRDWGDPAAPPLVLLHGLLGNSHEWNRVAELLSHERRVLVPDQRGHGASGWAEDYRADALVADLEAFVERLGLDDLDLAGHSMGGVVALLYAASSSRARTLTLLDIGPDALSDAESKAGFLGTLDALDGASYASPGELVDAWITGDPLARPTETRMWAERSLHRRTDGRWGWRVDLRGIGGFLTAAPEPARLWSAVRQVRVPTLVVHGEHSWALPPAAAGELEEALARGRRSCVPGAGHDLGVQAPEHVAGTVSAFLATSLVA